MHTPRRHRGVTLVEIAIGLAVVTGGLAMALPSMRSTLDRHAASTAMHLITADMATARSLALRTRESAVVCPSADGARCRDDGDWRAGWIVFSDPDGDRQPATGTPPARHSTPPGSGRLEVHGNRLWLRYQASGRSAHSNLTVAVCADGWRRGEVIVNNTGRVRSRRIEDRAPCTP